MCGFLVEFSSKYRLEKENFFRLLNQSNRRGPDHQGHWSDGEAIQMGFNRLAILELSEAGNQPMVSSRGQYALVFNGEIYNHLELRLKLSRKTFQGNSDTETICACLEEWGVEPTLEQLDGMFALAIYDSQDRSCTLARDFAGIKPLFYGWNGQTLVAASQYDQVATHPAFASEPIDPEVLRLYMEQHYLPAPFGLLRHTWQVQPGEIIRVDARGNLSKRRYWEFPTYAEPSVFDRQQALEALDIALGDSVRMELLSDVPLGAFLSGGIDSPLVCYYARQFSTGKLKAFSIGSDSAVHDESADARAYAGLMDLEQHLEHMQSGDAAAILEEVSRALHEPMADFSIIPTYLVSKLARQSVTVALSGDGGDELFFGYERFWSIAKNIRFQGLPYPVKYLAYGADRALSRNRHLNSAVLAPSQGAAHRGLHSRFPAGLMDQIAPGLQAVATPAAFNTYNYPLTREPAQLLAHMRKAEFYGMMQKTLRKVDLASMENSLEVRVPMLKKSFIEAALKLDPFLSYGPGKKKQLLKDLLLRRLPQSPVDNRKRGFSIPLSAWLRQQLREPFADVVLDAPRLKDWGFDPAQVQRMWSQHQSGERDHKWPIFTLYALMTWRSQLAK